MSNGHRIFYLDHLRALAVLVLIPFHTGRLFDYEPGYFVKFDQLIPFEMATRFVVTWFMPLFFMIAGASVIFSLRHRSVRAFFTERALRLMIPFCLGILLLMSVNNYFVYMHRYNVELSFFEYLPYFFQFRGLEGYDGYFSFGPMWFCGYLAAFCLAAPTLRGAMPGFGRGLMRMAGEAELGNRSAWIFVLGLMALLLAARLTLLPYPNPLYFIIFFAAGIALYALPTLREAVLGRWKAFLAAGALTMAVTLGLWFATHLDTWPERLYEGMRAVNATFWTLGLLGMGAHLLQKRRNWLLWINRHGLWLYVIHLPVTTIVGLQLHPLGLTVPVHFLATVVLSFVITLPLVMAVQGIDEAISKWWKARSQGPTPSGFGGVRPGFEANHSPPK